MKENGKELGVTSKLFETFNLVEKENQTNHHVNQGLN